MLLERLFFTADSTTLTISHGAAAIGALSGFLDRCSIASDGSVRAIVLNEEALRQILRIYLFRAENHKPKPLRRLLITCGLLINRLPNQDHRLHVVEEAVNSCVQAICEPELIVAVKSAIQLLEHLLSKQIIDAALILHKTSPLMVESVRELPEVKDGDGVQSFVGKVLEWVQYPDCAPAISHFLPIFFDSVRASRIVITEDQTVPKVETPSLWIESVRHFMRIHPDNYSVLEEHILPALLAHDKEEIGDFIHSLSSFRKYDLPCESYDMDDVLLCLLACRTASRVGSTQVNTLGLSKASMSEYSIDPTSLSLSFLDHSSPSVRLNALTTLVALVKPAEAFEYRTIARLKECIPYFLLETSSKPRNEFIAVMKKFSNNIRMAVPALTGKATEYERSNAAEFLLWYIRFLVQELRPTAPYQTHITALNLILGSFQSFARDTCVNNILRLTTPNYEQYKILFSQLSRVLLDLLFNAFDDVRQCSAEILDLLVQSEFHARSNTVSADSKATDKKEAPLTIINQILDCVPRAKDLFYRTGRADHADGLGWLLNLAFNSRQCSSNLYDQKIMYHDLIYELQRDIDEAVKDLDHAVRTAPLHGHLIALRYIIARTQTSFPSSSPACLSTFTFARNLLPLWHEIWNIVCPILCVDAPEGQVFPVSSSGDTAYGDQAKLSSCWRALKESSLLMSATISRIQSDAPRMEEIDTIRDDYQRIGELTFEQLAELRHRGAFSTVSQTFATWCIACRRLPGFESLLSPFYQKILACIYQKADAFTRRSAGLPAMVTGLLSAFPSGPFFDDVLLDLQAIADAPFEDTDVEDLLQLPQVHALNCLKDIFTDARFGFSSEPHISDCLDLATQCLDSPVWAIRNCGLMLLKALLNRINGGTDTSSTRVSSSHRRFSKLIYEKYPHLPQLTLSLLSPNSSLDTRRGGGGGSLHAQKVFPGLEIVERFGLPVSLRAPIEGAVMRHLEGPVWPLREKAARALSAGLASIDIVTEVKNLLSSPWNSQNALHGRLLYLRSLLLQKKGVLQAQLITDALFLLFDQYLERYVLEHECPVTAASYLDMVADLLEGVQQRVNEAPKRKEPSKPKSVRSESGERFIRRCTPFIDKILEVSNITLVPAGQALLVKSSKRLRNLLKQTRHDTIETDPAGSLELLLPRFPNNPQSREADLCRQGEILGAQFAQWPDDSPVLITMTMWTRSLVLASTDSLCELAGRAFWDPARLQKAPQDPETRLSAVSSIKHFVHSFSAAGGMLQETLEFLHIWLLLCDLLVDDDEDVRTQAAELTCEMMHKCAQHKGSVEQAWTVSPPATKGRLLDYIVHSYSQSDHLWIESIVRMTGQLSKVGFRSRIAAPGSWERSNFAWYRDAIGCFRPLDGFPESRSRSQPVFEEENHNLYLDPVREADLWTEAATSLVLPLSDEGRAKDQTGSTWFSALGMLLTALGEFKEITEVDGEVRKDSPLGYTSAPQAFSFIFAIICLLKLYSQGIKDAVIHQKLGGWLDEDYEEDLSYFLRSEGYKDRVWLQKHRLRARDARLHELLVSQLNDLHEDLDGHAQEELVRERISHLPVSPVD